MNQGRIWCVVHPTVGLPLLLGSVALTSLVVHGCLLSHTTWMSSYWMGKAARTAMLNTGAQPTAMVSGSGSAVSVKVTPVAATATSQASFVITVGPAAGQPPVTNVSARAAEPASGIAGVIHTASVN